MNTEIQPLSVLAGVNKLSSEDGTWTLQHPGEEECRAYRTSVTFGQAFGSVPVVHLGIVGFDISNEDAARVHVNAENISATGFDIVVGTWLNSRVWSVNVSWLAIGT